MDVPRKQLHNPNMSGSIPTYALYGETGGHHDWLHWETIQSRSRIHDYRIAPHRHEQLFQLLEVSGGEGSVTLDGTPFALGPGSLVIVPALTVHGYRFSPDIEGRVVTMLERDVASLGVSLPEAQCIPAQPNTLSALAGLLAEADQPGAGHDLAMRAYLTLLLVSLDRSAARAGRESGPADRSEHHARAFRSLVDRNFRQSRRVADYAREVGISQTHLNRVCRQVLGASALAVIERRIALEARRQLMFSTLPVKEIGAALGYDDPAYFTRFVTRALGMAPAAFRRLARTG